MSEESSTALVELKGVQSENVGEIVQSAIVNDHATKICATADSTWDGTWTVSWRVAPRPNA